MRTLTLFNDNWQFTKEQCEPTQLVSPIGDNVSIPHTWNNQDGQDGGGDYYRGKCWYTKTFPRPDMPQDGEVWLEFRGVGMIGEVFLNGVLLGSHEGGYSVFRVNATAAIKDQNLLAVSADNSANQHVYPQFADFTFYGGIYRDVYLITVPKSHFALGHFGSPGITVTSEILGDEAKVTVACLLENTPDGTLVEFAVKGVDAVTSANPDGDLIATATVKDGKATAILTIPSVRLWDGLNDPYLYTATAEITTSADKIEATFGCRTFSIDEDKGFFLNGKSYHLCGVARHQDREGVGSAITKAMQQEDMALIKEMGANTIRLAHYQHDPYFYELCDKVGMIVWAEIPYISMHMTQGRDNTISQLTELILQNINNPSIVCWGLSNEITVAGGESDDLYENHVILNDLAHKLDPTRKTAMAHVSMLSTDSKLIDLPDISSYNLYYGWYWGELEDMDSWFDQYKAQYPGKIIGLSEYGADANPRLQSPSPEKSDYTETYQAKYHAHMLAMWTKRPYIWAMHVWNMFDFGSDSRNEGARPGVNQKGLVSFDRKIKKDAYYAYKAYLSKEPFVHMCGRRYVDRSEAVTSITVYSNQSQVSLFMDGVEIGAKEGDKVFTFEAPITGQHTIEARAGAYTDSISIRKVDKPNQEYALIDSKIMNWFGALEVREGYLSVKDSLGDIKKSPEGAALLEAIMTRIRESSGNIIPEVKMTKELQEMIDRMTLDKTLGRYGSVISKEDIAKLNNALNQIPKL